MGLIPFHNDTDKVKHLGGKMIRPGETREVDESLLPKPAAKWPKDEIPAPDAELLAILDLAIKEIEPQLPSLTEEALDMLEAAEKAGKTRNGLLKAFTEERLRRAAADSTEKNMDDFATTLAEMDEDELLEQIELLKDDEGLLSMVHAEIERRAEANVSASEGDGGKAQGEGGE